MIIDGLQCGHFNQEIFRKLKKSGVGSVTVTAGFWSDTVETMDLISHFRDLCRQSNVKISLSANDIILANEKNQMSILIGSQNSDLLNGRVRFVELFADMGLRVMQLTYNNQNSLASSCYEEYDGGLARFGKEVIDEMNNVGMLIDLSHVGNRSTLEAINYSKKPVAITHANLNSVFPHARNKTDEVISALRDNGGIIGCAVYRNITGDYYLKSPDHWAELVEKTVEIAGIDHVGIGTDLGHGHEQEDYTWMRSGRWTRHVDYGAGSRDRPGRVPRASWLEDVSGLGRIPEALRKKGFSDDEVNKLTHKNWLRVYKEVFGA